MTSKYTFFEIFLLNFPLNTVEISKAKNVKRLLHHGVLTGSRSKLFSEAGTVIRPAYCRIQKSAFVRTKCLLVPKKVYHFAYIEVTITLALETNEKIASGPYFGRRGNPYIKR